MGDCCAIQVRCTGCGRNVLALAPRAGHTVREIRGSLKAFRNDDRFVLSIEPNESIRKAPFMCECFPREEDK